MPNNDQAVILYGSDGRALSVRRAYAGAFDASSGTRRTRNWTASREDVNTVLFGNLDTLRARCRDAVRKNPWAANALEGYVSSAIGVGIKPQSEHSDVQLRERIHRLWTRWVDEADAAGLTDFYGLQRLITRSSREGGECFVRLRYRRVEDGLSVPLQLQVLEAEHVPTYQLRTSEPAGNNVVRMGVEFDAVGRRVAYHMFREHPGALLWDGRGATETTRVPADQVLHVFEPLRPGQIRGLPWLTTVLLDLWELDQYTDAQVVKQKVAAMFVGWLKRANDGTVDYPFPIDSQSGGVAEASLEPGTLQTLLPGEDLGFSDPPDAGNFGEFVRAALRGIAAGLGITYEMLTGDLTQVNYSSIRAGLLEFRRRIEAYQHQVVAFQLCRPVWKAWLRAAWLSGALDLPGYEDDASEYEAVRWIAPGFPWVDPLKDITAKLMEIEGGLTSRSAAVSERGDDVEQVDAEQAADKERERRLGLAYRTEKPRAKTVSVETEEQDGRDGEAANKESEIG